MILLTALAALLVLCLALATVAAALAWQAAREARTAAQHAHATALQLARHAVQVEHLAGAVERGVTGAHPAARKRANTRGEKRDTAQSYTAPHPPPDAAHPHALGTWGTTTPETGVPAPPRRTGDS